MGLMPLLKGFQEDGLTDCLLILKDRFLDGIPAGVIDLGVAERLALLQNARPVKGLCFKGPQDVLDQPLTRGGIGKLEIQNIVKTAEEGAVEQSRTVSRSNDYAVRGILFDKLQQRVQNAAHLSDVILKGSFPPDGVE